MAKYIDADKIVEAFYKTSEQTGKYNLNVGTIDCCIHAVPPADVVEVVRCKDCKYVDKTRDGRFWCENGNAPFASDYAIQVKPSDFCSYGERRK